MDTFTLVFIATFVVILAYLACVLTIWMRVKAWAQRTAQPVPFNPFNGPVDAFKFLGFVFSDRHRQVDDPPVETLIWAVRVLLPIALILWAWMMISFIGGAG